MTWEKTFYYIPQYEFVSSNQHGMRYKRIGDRKLSCARLTANVVDTRDLQQLILLSHHLDLPVHYGFDTTPHTAFIEVIGKEGLK